MSQKTLTGDLRNLKFNAYREVAYDRDAAVQIIKDRKLAFGEPACVVFNFPDGDNTEKLMMLLGIGGMYGENFYMNLECDSEFRNVHYNEPDPEPEP